MSTKRRESAKRLKNADGVTVCSCGCGRIPLPPRKTWFSRQCVNQWREKNDPSYIRQQLKRRDKGICATCGCDSEAEFAAWKKAHAEAWRLLRWLESREEHRLCRMVAREQVHAWHRIVRAQMWPEKNPWAAKEKEAVRLMGPQQREGWTAGRKTAWDADHILEVVNGGGLCGLDNYQTLCHPCHKAKTAKLARERAEQRKQAKLIQAGDFFAAHDTIKIPLTNTSKLVFSSRTQQPHT